MRVLISGANGLIGSALRPFLEQHGHEVVALSTSPAPGAKHWNPARGEIDAAALEGVDAVVHLAGANIAAGRWTAARRRAILDSRLQGTRLLVDALSALKQRPAVFLCASATGFYGDTGDTIAAEDAEQGTGFLAGVCARWEAEAMRAQAAATRVVLLRAGLVLSTHGGALGKLLPLFRAGLGGRVGNGRAWMSWIAIDDYCGAVRHALSPAQLTGPVNLATPHPVRNREFAATLGRVLHRPAIVPLPGLALEIVFGQMARETLLASSRVQPQRLLESGYVFRHPQLEPALRHVLGR